MNQKDLIKKIENLKEMVGKMIVTHDPRFRKPVKLVEITNRGNMVILIEGEENLRELPLNYTSISWKVFN